MRKEPPPSRWIFPPPSAADAEGIVALGADLLPGTLLAAYRSGLFPMPIGRRYPMAWWSPDPRGVLPLESLRISRSLRASTRRFEVTVDAAFAQVVLGCSDPARPHGWISREIRDAYVVLHRLGWAHSVEAWAPDGTLAGGLYGVAIGGLFAGESMFSAQRDASKVALVHLVGLLRADPRPHRLLDVQWVTPHMQSLGARAIPREEYLALLARALELPLPEAFAQRSELS
ncbi:MAG TPA: leucyl/phenylalanyl-tRNA--protein transferase [Actinomycetes bacterium]|nr:leucyl/phenylalanyl-tRNA--protein transferase [Actinomycetes bacterium]